MRPSLPGGGWFRLRVLVVLLGAVVLGGEAASEQTPPISPDPVWRRLGLPAQPDLEAGRGVGIVLLDDNSLHPALIPLGERLKHLIVEPSGDVLVVEPLQGGRVIATQEPTHGVQALLQMAGAPFRVGDQAYGGVAPGATYFVVPYLPEPRGNGPRGEPQYDGRFDRVIDWVVSNRVRWNIRVILLETRFEYPINPSKDGIRDLLIENCKHYPLVRALEPAVKGGILVVNGNGNTSTMNNMPPADWLAVGAYDDSGHAAPKFHRENRDEPWGRNSDGHIRPDVLAPKYLVPNYQTPEGAVGYFGGTSSASAQVAGLVALLAARFPDADAMTLKQTLIASGDPIPESRRPGVRVNAARSLRSLTERSVIPPWPVLPPPVTISDPIRSLDSNDEVERALAVSALARHPESFFRAGDGELRPIFARLLEDRAVMVRKAAASAWGAPWTKRERAKLWELLHHEADSGVRGQLAILLLGGAGGDSLDDWIMLAEDPNWSARWCLVKVLRDHHPEAPHLDFAFNDAEIARKAEPLLTWYFKTQKK